MRALPLLLLAACHSDTPAELVEGGVDDVDLIDVPEGGLAFSLDTSADPELVFTGFGMVGQEQYGTWRAYDVLAVLPADDADLTDLEVAVEIDATSVDTGNSQMTRHLLSSDFFDAEAFPTASFRSTAVARVEGDLYEITGDLTVRGTTKRITYGSTILRAGDRITSTAHLELSRWDYGLYPASADGPGDDGVGDRVLLDYAVELVAVAVGE